MKRSIEKLRHEYGNSPLAEEELDSDPVVQFLIWLEEAVQAQLMEPNGMVLSTVSSSGRPASRTVLLKGIERGTFFFYTNYSSRKGEHLEHNPQAALTFWWREVYRQVHVEGSVKKVGRRRTLDYFKKRPRGAQLAALASRQSAPLAARGELDLTYQNLQKKYRGKDVPCPKEWGGYALKADRMEFWQGRKNRLHDRFLYVKTNGEWVLTRLAP